MELVISDPFFLFKHVVYVELQRIDLLLCYDIVYIYMYENMYIVRFIVFIYVMS